MEILDGGANEWRDGPDLPSKMVGTSMVEDVSGGVVLIGGRDESGKFLDTLYHLSFDGTEWIEMPQKLKTARIDATTFYVPNDIAGCV